MPREILGLDIKQIVRSARAVLVGKREIPIKCPKRKCVGLHSIRDMGINGIQVTLDANPPKPKKGKGLLYKVDPVCGGCIFNGNHNILTELVEKDSKITDIRVAYDNDR